MYDNINLEDINLDEKRVDIWKQLQIVEYETYKKSPIGVFSVDSCKGAIEVGNFLRDNVKGKCLDVGCGLLSEPAYMKNQPNIEFIGIDPFDDKIKREFKFVCGIGEYLPFEDETFDGVLFATTIDHMINPQLAINEAYRVLKDKGVLIIWYTERNKPHLIYGNYDEHHQWGFTNEILIDFIQKAQFKKSISCVVLESGNCEYIITTRK